MLLIVLLLSFLYLKYMFIRHAAQRFYNDICFYFSFSTTFIVLSLFIIWFSIASGSLWGLLIILAMAAYACLG